MLTAALSIEARSISKIFSQCSRIKKTAFEHAVEDLRDKLEATDWNVLCNATNLDENVSVISEYINFCYDQCVQKETIKCYPNNKPWVTKELKMLLNDKKRAVSVKNKDELRRINSELKKAIFKCKLEYKDKMEKMFDTNDTGLAWSNLKKLCGYSKKSSAMVVDDDWTFSNDLNEFYARFDTENFCMEQNELIQVLKNVKDKSICINESDVEKWLSRINVKKATGPDSLCGKVLKCCRKQLACVLTKVFQVSLDSHYVPKIWKTSEIVPVPKKTLPKVKNDLRPVALTAIVFKCFERIVLCNFLMPVVKPFLDTYQFAYTSGVGVDDAVITLNDILRTHLDSANSHSRILFVDFSSAFNTIQPHILMKKLIEMNVNSNIILWIHSFLTERVQYVNFNGTKSGVIIINTGAPQGCVLSAFLFTIYTTDCTSSSKQVVILKYADDTVIIGLLSNNDETSYRQEVMKFCKWCDDNYLNLNVSKTKEMLVDFRKIKSVISPLNIKDENVEIVSNYKYLGNIIDNQLTGIDNVKMLIKKANKKLYFLRKLKTLKVSNTVLSMFYRCMIQSTITFCLPSWYNLCNASDKKKLGRIVKCAVKLGCDVQELDSLYHIQRNVKLEKIMKNVNHPLNYKFNLLPSRKRLRSIPSNTNRLRNSFVLSAIRSYCKR